MLLCHTMPSNTHMSTEKFGTFPAAAHEWFVFLNPSHLEIIQSITKTV